jgi:protein-arginine kinase activator protein McsA
MIFPENTNLTEAKCENCGLNANDLLLRTIEEKGRIKHEMVCLQCFWLLKHEPKENYKENGRRN